MVNCSKVFRAGFEPRRGCATTSRASDSPTLGSGKFSIDGMRTQRLKTGATGLSQFISGREINAASAFKFYLNVVLIEMGFANSDRAGSQALCYSRSTEPLEQR
jgi:hypothetical protein